MLISKITCVAILHLIAGRLAGRTITQLTRPNTLPGKERPISLNLPTYSTFLSVLCCFSGNSLLASM